MPLFKIPSPLQVSNEAIMIINLYISVINDRISVELEEYDDEKKKSTKH